MKIWVRHIVYKLTTSFILFLVLTFSLYVLVDMAVQSERRNYLHMFFAYFSLFTSLAFLLAMLRTLLDLNMSRELVALQMAGLSKIKLLTPLFVFTCVLGVAGICNALFWQHNPSRDKRTIFSQKLVDGSTLVFRDPNHDLFWVLPQEIRHIEKKEGQTAYEIDCFTRSPITLKDHLQKAELPAVQKPKISPFHLIEPFIPLILLLCVAPFALRYSRRTPALYLTAVSLFGLFTLKVFLDGLQILM